MEGNGTEGKGKNGKGGEWNLRGVYVIAFTWIDVPEHPMASCSIHGI